MLFNSYIFVLVFLPITLILYYLSAKKLGSEAARWVLVLASLFFYSWWDVKNLPILLGSILVNYFVVLRIGQSSGRARKGWLISGIVFDLALLGYFKYTAFAVETVNQVLGADLTVPHLVLPLGISFFTFTQIACLVDSYRAETAGHAYTKSGYFLFVTIFPHLIIGFLEDAKPRTKFARRYPVLGGFSDLERVVAENRVRRVIIAAPGLSQKMQADLLYRAQAVCRDVGIVPNLVEVPMADITVESFYDARVMILHIQNNLSKWSNRAVKWIFDIIATLLGGLLISPVLLGLALWVKLDSPGPVLYKHRRIGRDGRVFHCYKFRSMCVDSEARLQQLLATDEAARKEWESTFKLKHDPRITRAGAILRKTSLDELPQLFNVLRGEMSLVGPRPIVEKEVPYYGAFIREYYMVRPGITGMWQVSGRSDVDYPERVRMDSWYVHNWSIWLDLLLLWRTFKVVINEKGAY